MEKYIPVTEAARLVDRVTQSSAQPPLLTGDFYPGAYGPTIILSISSVEACAWLQGAFRELARSGAPRKLAAEPEVRLANIHGLEMIRRSTGPRVSLSRRRDEADADFVWAATADGWLYLADLIQSFCDGGSGHHYLTENTDDAALIELSFGEDDVPDVEFHTP